MNIICFFGGPSLCFITTDSLFYCFPIYPAQLANKCLDFLSSSNFVIPSTILKLLGFGLAVLLTNDYGTYSVL